MEDKIKADLREAQLSRDEIRVSTLRLLLSEINNTKIAKGQALDDAEVTSVVQKEAKKRRESIEAYRGAGRTEAADKEQKELLILQGYLPSQLSNEELTKVVEDSITEVGARSISDMGKVMGVVMSKVGQSAEGSQVSTLVREKLSS